MTELILNTYLELLAKNYLPEIELILNPILFSFYQGLIFLQTDKFGKLKVTMEGCRKRDEFVFYLVKEKIFPALVAMGGGYSPDIKTDR